jgi:hypothetical protein
MQFPARLFALSLLLASCASAPAKRQISSLEPVKMGGTWKGTYTYPDYLLEKVPDPVDFTFHLEDSPQGLSGKSREPNTFGEKSAPELKADLTGYSSPSGQFHIYKKMDGTGGVTHTIEYDGQLSEDGRSAAGQWFIPGAWSGKFRMER